MIATLSAAAAASFGGAIFASVAMLCVTALIITLITRLF